MTLKDVPLVSDCKLRVEIERSSSFWPVLNSLGKKKIIFRISSFDVWFFSVNSTGPDNETFSPGKNFNEFGLGVFNVCTNIISI